ncbi:Sua5/YciO/YrdC/YwlC family protein [Streptomyces chartreusis]|uniref:Sua5/YciO/YrdC/YwlC family protein n=1 Tax=Streptomyces chartreusis TaxID=1969 RepID=UPI0037242D96
MNVYDCRTEAAMRTGVGHVTDALRSGHPVVFPADTVYGIGGHAFDHEAVGALTGKRSGADKRVSVRAADWPQPKSSFGSSRPKRGNWLRSLRDERLLARTPPRQR